VNLHDRNTLGLPARADQVIAVTDVDQLPELSRTLHDHARCILGGGSNVVLHAPIPAAVLCNQLRGKHISPTGLLTAASGEPWHDLVMWSLDQGFAGLENLALIPGTVGGAPVQNIGAYGVEISRYIVDVHAWDFHAQRYVVLRHEDCQFSYRHSIFKMPTVQGPWNAPRYFITQVSFQLAPMSSAVLHTDYHELHEALQRSDARPPYSARDVAQAVIAIRQRKLPDPQALGNVGSFFKNPIIGQVQAKHLTLLHPDLPHYPADDGRHDAVKISAAWLIERCGFKGARRGDVGVYSGHALVLVNHGGGTGREILALAQEIQQAVVARFGVFLEPEPVFLPAIG